MEPHRASQACIDLIEHFEGLRLASYWDSHGMVWTIGYGHTGKDVTGGQTITRRDADALLMQDVLAAENIIRGTVDVPLTQGQFDALVSFVFNVGAGIEHRKAGFVRLVNGKPSTLLAKLRVRDYAGAADEFPKWVYAGGKLLRGLVRRRAAERALFLTGNWRA